jgi:alanine dehydrogenase
MEGKGDRMHIGIPREVKTLEGRVALVPDACAELVQAGHRVFIEARAGAASGYADDAYRAAGVEIQPDAAALYGAAGLIIKVKEPVEPDLALLRRDHLLFCYLHLAADRALTERLQAIGLTAVAFETVRAGDGLPLLAPMSAIAGRLAVQIGTYLLHRPQGGKGVLLGGVAGAARGRVAVIGAGTAGGNAAALAAALGAEVTVFDPDPAALARMQVLGANVTALYPHPEALTAHLPSTDLLIGATLVPGRRAAHVVTAAMIAGMAPGSVVVDISVDQGGCIETTRPTDYAEPTYTVGGVIHFAVTNMPGAVPRTATQALSAALMPYAKRIAEPDWEDDASMAAGLNIKDGQVVHPGVRAAFGM